ncbi:MAG TPA: lantibiotic dehydratase [Ktedonobacteraceae bacterium]|nr:lantibiotic dehydratase [Ktedonobacteraceae bacterium]
MAVFIQKAESTYIQRIITPRFLLRVGGLPMNVVDDLRFEQTGVWIETLLTLEQALIERKDRLVDALHEEVNICKEQVSMRRKLINLKRDVFNMRQFTDFVAIRGLAVGLSSPTREWLEEWADIWERYQHVFAKGSELFQQEIRQKRAVLKQLVNEEDFRKGILLSSPVLEQAMDAYLASDNAQLNRNARTAERSLVEYLLRTACKTSPFSTFTTVSSGTIEACTGECDHVLTYKIDSTEKKSFIRLNMAILSKLSSLIVSTQSVRKDLPVQITPGYHIHNNRIRYLRRMQDINDVEEETPVSLDTVHENVFYLPVGKLLTALLSFMGNRKVRYMDIITSICSLSAYEGAEEEIDEYLQHLLRLGLLVIPDLQQDIHNPYPLASYRRGLRTIGTPVTDRVAELLGEIERSIETYATAPVSQRRELFSRIKQQVRACYTELGQANTPIPRTLVYEDTTVPFRKLRINAHAWEYFARNFAELQQVLPALDVNLPRKLVTRGYFQACYGPGQRCDDFLSFAYEFRQGFFEQYLQANGVMPAERNEEQQRPRRINYFQQPEFEMIDAAQQAIDDYMQKAYQQLPPASKELRLDEDFVSSVLPYIPGNTGNLSSHTLFSHLANVDGERLLIINRIYMGLTVMFSRFAHFLDVEEGHHLVADLRTHLKHLQPPGAVFAELKGGYDATNLNLHPQVTAYELVCPGDISTRPLEEQIPLDDLSIQDDVHANCLRLCSKRLGKEVIPLYLGFLMPMALPEIQQVLLNFSYSTMSFIDLWNGVKRQDAGAAIAYYPRLRYKNLILQRAQWRVRADALPKRESGESDGDFFFRMARWRRQQNLPARVFVSPALARDLLATPQAEEPPPRGKMPTYKPLYVDFENYFSVALLEALSRDASLRLVISEMLPGHEQLWLEHNGQSYVSEFVWEMNSLLRRK